MEIILCLTTQHTAGKIVMDDNCKGLSRQSMMKQDLALPWTTDELGLFSLCQQFSIPFIVPALQAKLVELWLHRKKAKSQCLLYSQSHSKCQSQNKTLQAYLILSILNTMFNYMIAPSCKKRQVKVALTCHRGI